MLLEKTDLTIEQEQLILLDTLMFYQLEGRYPQYFTKIPANTVALLIFENTKNLFLWLKSKL